MVQKHANPMLWLSVGERREEEYEGGDDSSELHRKIVHPTAPSV